MSAVGVSRHVGSDRQTYGLMSKRCDATEALSVRNGYVVWGHGYMMVCVMNGVGVVGGWR